MTSDLKHPIIALWVHPRSMSTAMERIMRERNDLYCFHEPFMYYYYIGLGKRELPHSDLHVGKPDSFKGIVDQFEERAKSEPVFFKDMSYYVVPEIYEFADVVNQWCHLILVRNPRKSILSYYKLDPDFPAEEAGLETQWNLYEWLGEIGAKPPLVVEAEKVQIDPVKELTRVWNYLGLDFKKQAFQWDESSTPEDWKTVTGWHGNVISSTGIRPASSETEQEIIERFEKAAKESPRLAELLDYHLPYYLKLKAVSENLVTEK